MLNVIKNTYLNVRFFYLWGGVIALLLLSYAYPQVQPIAIMALGLLLLATLADLAMLFSNAVQVHAERNIGNVISVGATTEVSYVVTNRSSMKLHITLLDELPEQLQQRNFNIPFTITEETQSRHQHTFRPLTRGEYNFGNLYCFISSPLGIVQRRQLMATEYSVAVYPSILDMKKYELHGFNRNTNEQGIKKLRRIGHSYEFEQIKNYVAGDDYRSINWKATSRKGDLMVNQYEDEKAQSVYMVIDKSRVMKMPFNGLSLLDYAINSSLVVANVALNRQDKAGLITFSDKVNTTILANRGRIQLKKILESLYKEKEHFVEANYELLYLTMRNFVKNRSLVLFYTNFESAYALHRVLPLLRKINQKHLLVVVFFENTEINQVATQNATTIEEIHNQAIAQKYMYEKQQLAQELKQYGIYSVLTKPEDLTVNTVNKYLELKSRGLL